jgi:hypothetical protein
MIKFEDFITLKNLLVGFLNKDVIKRNLN